MDTRSSTYAATVAHRLTTALLILSVVFGVFIAVQAIRGADGDVAVEATAAINNDLLPDGVYATSAQRTGIAIEDATNRERRLSAGRELLALLLWIAVLWLLRGITRSARDGDPFIGANVRRLQAIAGLLILGVIAVYFARNALEDELLASYSRTASAFDTPGLRPPYRDFPESAPLYGLGVLVLAQVFAQGVRLREDVDATI